MPTIKVKKVNNKLSSFKIHLSNQSLIYTFIFLIKRVVLFSFGRITSMRIGFRFDVFREFPGCLYTGNQIVEIKF